MTDRRSSLSEPARPGLAVERWTIGEEHSLERLIDRDGWAELMRPTTLYDSEPWHRLLWSENTLVGRLLSASRRGRIVALLPMYLWSGEWSLLTQHQDEQYRAIARLRSLGPTAFFPTLLLGSVGGSANDLTTLGAAADDPELLAALLRRCERAGRDMGAQTLGLPNLSLSTAKRVRDASGARVTLWAAEPAAYIEVGTMSFEDYLSALSQKRRASARREIRALEGCGHRARIEPLAGWIAEMAPLLAELQARHHLPSSSSVLAGFLERLARAIGERARAVVVESGGQLMGFCILLEHQADLHAYKIGFDSDRARRCGIYFNIGYYEPLRYAMANGLRRLHLGPGSLAAKLLRGARLEPRYFAAWEFGDVTTMARLAKTWNELHLMRVRRLLEDAGQPFTDETAAAFTAVSS